MGRSGRCVSVLGEAVLVLVIGSFPIEYDYENEHDLPDYRSPGQQTTGRTPQGYV